MPLVSVVRIVDYLDCDACYMYLNNRDNYPFNMRGSLKEMKGKKKAVLRKKVASLCQSS